MLLILVDFTELEHVAKEMMLSLTLLGYRRKMRKSTKSIKYILYCSYPLPTW